MGFSRVPFSSLYRTGLPVNDGVSETHGCLLDMGICNKHRKGWKK